MPTNLKQAPTTAREIGSDFEVVGVEYLLESANEKLPWDSETTTYVGSGRQALAAASRALWEAGYRKIHLPEYLCDSMVEPFLSAEWTVCPLPVTSNLEVEPAAVAGLTQTAILNAPYFGRSNHPELEAALRSARDAGSVVIADETHRVFDAPVAEADVRVASLRKLLPVFDGGYVVGIPWDAIHLGPADEDLATQRQSAMQRKSSNLSKGASDGSHLDALRRTESGLANRLAPAALSALSHRLLERLDLTSMRSRRRDNATALADALSPHVGFRILNPPESGCTPSHLVLELPDPYALRTYLASHEIYCPVHWPPSELVDTSQPWPQRFISLPVDHRYVAADMHRLAHLVHQYFAGAPAASPRRTS